MTDEFERRHGFAPGPNEVRPANRDDRTAARALALALARASLVPADLVTFYDTIGDITWSDVGNGHFLDPASDVLLRLQEYGPVDLGTNQRAHGLAIGSDGGGLSYVVGPDGSVHRTRTASLDEPELDKLADDLRQFLELLERTLTNGGVKDAAHDVQVQDLAFGRFRRSEP
ncbi:SMI1/KNR4 family protein [Streptomyces sp. NPDC005435]|uniref:SMI1/KNR4 family protein n=1 Tax=Streptomyces sp. NPDC005435 TaxID=3154464 RepID=UPI0034551ADB